MTAQFTSVDSPEPARLLINGIVAAESPVHPKARLARLVVHNLDPATAHPYTVEGMSHTFSATLRPEPRDKPALRVAAFSCNDSTGQYGIEAHDDAAGWIATPAIANIWPRRWFPREPGENRRADDPAYTGRFLDGFSNRVTADGTGFLLGSRGMKTTNRLQSLLGLAYLSGALGLSPLTANPAGSSDLVPIFGPERFTL
jgi:hypothetical protein